MEEPSSPPLPSPKRKYKEMRKGIRGKGEEKVVGEGMYENKKKY